MAAIGKLNITDFVEHYLEHTTFLLNIIHGSLTKIEPGSEEDMFLKNLAKSKQMLETARKSSIYKIKLEAVNYVLFLLLKLPINLLNDKE